MDAYSADRVKEWNTFKTKDRESEGDKIESCFDISTKALKIVTCMFIVCGVVILNMLSKGSLLLAASNLRPPHKAEFTSISQLPKDYLVCRNYTEVTYKNVTHAVHHMALCVMISRDQLSDVCQNDDSATYSMTSQQATSNKGSTFYACKSVTLNVICFLLLSNYMTIYTTCRISL